MENCLKSINFSVWSKEQLINYIQGLHKLISNICGEEEEDVAINYSVWSKTKLIEQSNNLNNLIDALMN